MHARLESLVETVGALIDALEGASFDYALGGAIALSAWSEPRATTDVDLTLWVSDADLEDALSLLERAGVRLDKEQARAESAERGMFVGRHSGYRIDVFVPSIPFYGEARKRRVRVHLAERDTWVLSAETLVVFKMLFFRPKDLVDIARLLEVRPGLEKAFVRTALIEIVGEDDERVRRWDEISLT